MKKYVKTKDNKVIDVTDWERDIDGNFYRKDEDKTTYIYFNDIIIFIYEYEDTKKIKQKLEELI